MSYARGFLAGIALACRLQRRISRLARQSREVTRFTSENSTPNTQSILRPSDRRRTETT